MLSTIVKAQAAAASEVQIRTTHQAAMPKLRAQARGWPKWGMKTCSRRTSRTTAVSSI